MRTSTASINRQVAQQDSIPVINILQRVVLLVPIHTNTYRGLHKDSLTMWWSISLVLLPWLYLGPSDRIGHCLPFFLVYAVFGQQEFLPFLQLARRTLQQQGEMK
ncbi:uncharacterized protein LOC134277525 [Saccostrea cucullata]|uniref:uncharacterized protein LOC134277525 n=1 Tax=Saccostrea cuccullata TaxID=36930 RepID=UPI002ED0D9DC